MTSRQTLRLGAQGFEGSPLDRSLLATEGGIPDDVEARSDSHFLPVVGNKPFMLGEADKMRPVWLSHEQLQQAAGSSNSSLADTATELYMLGRHPDGAYCIAANLTQLGEEAACSAVQQAVPNAQLTEARSLMRHTKAEDLSMIGHALALCTWHNVSSKARACGGWCRLIRRVLRMQCRMQTHRFCNQCGSRTRAVTHGSRRQCDANSSHRSYPRTDPVVIMLVVSSDGQRALLGRSKKVPEHIRTCLSGFVDQCESIEEAVRREVWEEVGVKTGDVSVIGSQPWPIGRGGSCELMIGAVAVATSTDINLNAGEMGQADWYSRETLQQAVQEASQPNVEHFDPKAASERSELGIMLPPPTAIAFSIIRSWTEADGGESKL